MTGLEELLNYYIFNSFSPSPGGKAPYLYILQLSSKPLFHRWPEDVKAGDIKTQMVYLHS